MPNILLIENAAINDHLVKLGGLMFRFLFSIFRFWGKKLECRITMKQNTEVDISCYLIQFYHQEYPRPCYVYLSVAETMFGLVFLANHRWAISIPEKQNHLRDSAKYFKSLETGVGLHWDSIRLQYGVMNERLSNCDLVRTAKLIHQSDDDDDVMINGSRWFLCTCNRDEVGIYFTAVIRSVTF